MANNLGIKSTDAAKSWESEVEALNEENRKLLESLGTTLQQVKEDADSTFVDEIYNYGTRICEGTTKIFEGMNGLVNVVKDIRKGLEDLIFKNTDIVRNVSSRE